MTRRVARLRAGRGWAGGCAGHASGRPGAAASRSRAFSHLHWPRAVLSPAVVRAGAVRPDRQRRVIFRLPGPGPPQVVIRAGQCAPSKTTHTSHLSGRPGAAASRPTTISHFHWPGAVRTRAVVSAGAVRPSNVSFADATVTSAVVRLPHERPARRRRSAPEGLCAPDKPISPTRHDRSDHGDGRDRSYHGVGRDRSDHWEGRDRSPAVSPRPVESSESQARMTQARMTAASGPRHPQVRVDTQPGLRSSGPARAAEAGPRCGRRFALEGVRMGPLRPPSRPCFNAGPLRTWHPRRRHPSRLAHLRRRHPSCHPSRTVTSPARPAGACPAGRPAAFPPPRCPERGTARSTARPPRPPLPAPPCSRGLSSGRGQRSEP